MKSIAFIQGRIQNLGSTKNKRWGGEGGGGEEALIVKFEEVFQQGATKMKTTIWFRSAKLPGKARYEN